MRSTFALFYVALLGEFGWSRGHAALGYSLSWLCLLAFSPLAGWLHDRWGARRVVPLGGLLLGTALALTGRVTSLPQYYMAFGVLGAAGIACIMMPAAAVVGRSFVRLRGAAMGLISAGSSASAVIFYPLNTWLIVAFGWRTALLVYGLIVILGVVPLAIALYRDPPDEIEDGGQPAPRATVRDALPANPEWTVTAALRDSRFWAVFAMWALGVIGYQIIATHQVAHALDRGFDPATLAWAFGLGGAFTVAGNLLGGALSDRWGRQWVFTWGTVVGIAGIAGLAALGGAHDLPLLLAYVVSQVGFGMRIALLAAIPADLFQGRHLGAILGLANGGGGLGGFIGPFLGGWLFDVTGSYQIAFAAAALTVGGSAVAAWIARPPAAETNGSPA